MSEDENDLMFDRRYIEVRDLFFMEMDTILQRIDKTSNHIEISSAMQEAINKVKKFIIQNEDDFEYYQPLE